MAEFLVPDTLEPAVGWRAWDVYGFLLCSVTSRMRWMPRQKLVARCSSNPAHDAPKEGCACGIYAAYSRAHLEAQRYHNYRHIEQPAVIGEVYLYGRLEECERGWKAQYAYPKRLIVPTRAYERVEGLRRLYGVEVTVEETLLRGRRK